METATFLRNDAPTLATAQILKKTSVINKKCRQEISCRHLLNFGCSSVRICRWSHRIGLVSAKHVVFPKDGQEIPRVSGTNLEPREPNVVMGCQCLSSISIIARVWMQWGQRLKKTIKVIRKTERTGRPHSREASSAGSSGLLGRL